MTTLEYHSQAMQAWEIYLFGGEKPRTNFDAAFEAIRLESVAADLLEPKPESEPTRSILFRSAASMSLAENSFLQAEQFAYRGLAGFPSEEIRSELKAILQNGTFGDHWQTQGIALSDNEVQLSLSGNGVGEGVVEKDEIFERVELFESLLTRQAERISQLPFRTNGRPKKQISDSVMVFLTVARAASYAVTLRVGKPQQELPFNQPDALPNSVDAPSVLSETISTLKIFEVEGIKGVSSFIQNEEYARNFVEIAGRLAPDGASVSQVAFTMLEKGGPNDIRPVALRKTRKQIRSEISKEPRSEVPDTRTLTLTGELRSLDSVNPRNPQVALIPDGEQPIKIRVSAESMDILHPLFLKQVSLRVRIGRFNRYELLNVE